MEKGNLRTNGGNMDSYRHYKVALLIKQGCPIIWKLLILTASIAVKVLFLSPGVPILFWKHIEVILFLKWTAYSLFTQLPKYCSWIIVPANWQPSLVVWSQEVSNNLVTSTAWTISIANHHQLQVAYEIQIY